MMNSRIMTVIYFTCLMPVLPFQFYRDVDQPIDNIPVPADAIPYHGKKRKCYSGSPDRTCALHLFCSIVWCRLWQGINRHFGDLLLPRIASRQLDFEIIRSDRNSGLRGIDFLVPLAARIGTRCTHMHDLRPIHIIR